MIPRRELSGRAAAIASVVLVSLAILAALPGCSSGPREVVAPAQSSLAQISAATDAPPELTPPLPLDRWKSPRIRVWTTDGWRQAQNEGGVSLDPSRIYDLELTEPRPVTFNWTAGSMFPNGRIVGYRWAVDLLDIFDERPRSGPDDVTAWSAWNPAEQSATVGPLPDPPATHYFYLEARDSMGLVSLFVVAMRTGASSAEEPRDLPVARR